MESTALERSVRNYCRGGGDGDGGRGEEEGLKLSNGIPTLVPSASIVVKAYIIIRRTFSKVHFSMLRWLFLM